MKVHFAAILNFFFQTYLSVTFFLIHYVITNKSYSFKTLYGSINDCILLPDGVHPNLTWTERLAKSLGVDKDACCIMSRPASQNIQRKKREKDQCWHTACLWLYSC